jgi:hypothetical protein
MRLNFLLLSLTLLHTSPSGFGKGTLGESILFPKVLNQYIEIEKSLAQDNLALVAELGENFKKSLEALTKEDLKETEKKEMTELLGVVTQFSESKNNTEYRIRFGNISKMIVTHLKSHKGETKDLQLFFCPMFPQGYAFWVQKKPEALANPYWGKEMLTCGVKRPW